MLNSNYLRNISRSLLSIYAATAISTAIPSNSFAQRQEMSEIEWADSLIYYHSSHAITSHKIYDPTSEGKIEYATHIQAELDNKRRKGLDIKKEKGNYSYNILDHFGGSIYYKRPPKQLETVVGGQTIIKTQGKKSAYEAPVIDSLEIQKKLDKMYEISDKKDDLTKKKYAKEARVPTRIVKRSTKLKLVEGDLPQGTSIVTTQDDSDFLKTPVRTKYYSFPSAWGLIEGLELASGRQDISDLLATALPEVRKYMFDLEVPESVMRRFEIDDKKVVGGRVLRGPDGLPLDNIYPNDDLLWSARVLAKRDYKHLPPEVAQKALEQIVRTDTLYIKFEPKEPEPQPITQTTQITKVEHKKDNTLLYVGVGLVVGGVLYAILRGKKDKKQPQQPSGFYSQEGGTGVQ